MTEAAFELLQSLRKDGGPESFNNWASKYDNLLGDLNYAGYDSVLSKWKEYCSEDKPQGRPHRMLDAGCGTGLLGESVHKVVSMDEVELYGGDYSPGMLEEAKQKGIYSDLKVINLKTELPYDEGFFDSIVSSGVFLTIGTMLCDHTCLPNVTQVLKSGGYFITTATKETYKTVEKDWEQAVKECGCQLIEMTEMPYLNECSAFVLVIRKN